MIRTVRLRPKAEADLDEIWAWTVARWSETQAIAYLEGMEAGFRLLAEYPEIARLRQELSPPVRLYRYRRHVIVFRAGDAGLEILRVLHSRANWQSLLAE